MNEEPEERIWSIRKVFDDSDNEDDENEETNDKPASPARHDENPEDPEAHPTHSWMDISLQPPNSPMDTADQTSHTSHDPSRHESINRSPSRELEEPILERVKEENVEMEENEDDPDGGLEAWTNSPAANHYDDNVQLNQEEHQQAANELLVSTGLLRRHTNDPSELEKSLQAFLVTLIKDDQEAGFNNEVDLGMDTRN